MIPTRDTRDLTLACLRSLRDLEGRHEIIVVDDGGASSTTREAVASHFPSAKIIRRQESGGFTVAANQGLGSACGELLLLLNSDTEVASVTLEALRQRFAETPSLGVAGGLLWYPDGAAQWSGGREPSLVWLFTLASGIGPLLSRLPFYRALFPVRGHGRPVTWVAGTAMAIRRATWEEVGPFDERFAMYCQDLDFCLRADHHGWATELVEELQVIHHHGATIGRNQGVAARQDPGRLWADLVRWASKHRGEGWARRARRALCWGAKIRVACRRLVRPLASQPRHAWNSDTAFLRRAIRELERAELG